MCSIRRIRVRLDIYSNIRFAYSFYFFSCRSLNCCECGLICQLLNSNLIRSMAQYLFQVFQQSVFFSGCFGLMVPKHHRIKSSLHAEKRYLTNCSKTNHFAFAQCQYNVLFDSVTEVFSPVSLFVRFIHMCRNGDDVWVGAKPRNAHTHSHSLYLARSWLYAFTLFNVIQKQIHNLNDRNGWEIKHTHTRATAPLIFLRLMCFELLLLLLFQPSGFYQCHITFP